MHLNLDVRDQKELAKLQKKKKKKGWKSEPKSGEILHTWAAFIEL